MEAEKREAYLTFKNDVCSLLGADIDSIESDGSFTVKVAQESETEVINGMTVNQSVDVVISDDELRPLYEEARSYVAAQSKPSEKDSVRSSYSVEMYTSKLLEIPVEINQVNGWAFRHNAQDIIVKDDVNGLVYRLGMCSVDYAAYLLLVCENSGNSEALRFRKRRAARVSPIFDSIFSWQDLLRFNVHVITSSVTAKRGLPYGDLVKLVSAFDYCCMYDRSVGVSELHDLHDLFHFGRRPVGFRGSPRLDREVPPRKSYESHAIDYYRQAVSSRDPFVQYISFYHVLEFFFERVFRESVASMVRDAFTDISFSFDDERLYQVAVDISDEMGRSQIGGFGNERQELLYVLEKYVGKGTGLNLLKARINELWNGGVDYYQHQRVSFVVQKKAKPVNWNDTGVLANITDRVYQTRNALVHSKDIDGGEGRYNPFSNASELRNEIPLIRALSERVIEGSGRAIRMGD